MRSPQLLLLVALGVLCMASAKGMTVGGISEPTQEVSAEAVSAAESAVAQASASNELNLGPLTLVKVIDVQTQVVSGMNYYLTMEVTDQDGAKHIVKATVWSQPWMRNSNDATAGSKLTKISLVE